MRSGWVSSADGLHYAASDGQARTSWIVVSGWRHLDGSWYYFDESDGTHPALTGFFRPAGDPRWFHADGEGHLTYGWQQTGAGAWTFANGNGELVSGWQYLGGSWYWFQPDVDCHPAITGLATIGDFSYYFDGTGHMAMNTVVEVDGAFYIAGPSGNLTSDYPIMGSSGVTADRLVAAWSRAGYGYPSEALSAGGAPTFRDFARIVVEEAEAEGVRPEVVFAQSMLETGWLQFGGDVSVTQFNFAGLGATGGVPGLSFADVRTGIRAQVQHLKAYASTEALNNECVDPRFGYVTRGCAPTVMQLGNRWAASSTYGSSIMSIIATYDLH